MKGTALLLIFSLMSALHFAGCRRSDYNDKLILQKRYHYNRIKKIDTLLFYRNVPKDTINYIYQLNRDTLGLSCKKSIHNDSSIVFGKHKCPLLAKKTITINKKKHQIFKYHYDVNNSSDEETNFFFHMNYGILVQFNVG